MIIYDILSSAANNTGVCGGARYKTVVILVKNFWRALWLAVVALGGVSMVRLALGILDRDKKKYIDV